MDESAFWDKTEREPEPDGCWLWAGGVARDYGMVWYKGKYWRAHRLSWTLTNGPIPKGLYVLHDCDTPLCIRPDHLYLGTQSDNMRDMYRRGRRLRPGQRPGEQHAMAKLTERDVHTIHARLQAGEPYAALAIEYGVTGANIRAIAKGRSWRHLRLSPIIRQGSSRADAKLHETDIPTIIQRIQQGDSIGKVAHDYRVSRTLISDIWHGKAWKHVPRS